MNIHVLNPSCWWTDPGLLSLLIFLSVVFLLLCLMQTKASKGWGLCQKFLCRHQIFIFPRKDGGPSAIRLARISNSFLNHCTIQVGKPSRVVKGGCSRSFGRFTSETTFNNTGNVAVENKLYIVSCVIFSHCMCRYWSCCFSHSVSLSLRSFVTAGSFILTDRWWHCRTKEGFSIKWMMTPGHKL